MPAWYHIDNIAEIDSPALVLYQQRVQQNIALLKGMIDDVQRLRPHIKTHKSPDATKLLLHDGLKKFKCATIAEAELLADCGAPDVLLAYQPVGPKISRFIELIKRFPSTTFSCLVDNVDAAEAIAKQAALNGFSIPVFIDINVGMNRTGIAPQDAVALYRFCSSLSNLTPVGLHVYDGHITDSDMELRTEHCNAAFEPVQRVQDQLVHDGFATPVIVAGGSVTFPIHAQRRGVECSPGTFIYWDAGYANLCPEQPFQPAALVIARVISMPAPDRICVDLGHKAVAAENILAKRVAFLNAPDVVPVSQSEEHLMLEVAPNHSWRIGDVLFGLPQHICPTCNLYERAYVVNDGRINGEWQITARDRKLHV